MGQTVNSLPAFIERATCRQLLGLAFRLLIALFWPLFIFAALASLACVPISPLMRQLPLAKSIATAIIRRAFRDFRSLISTRFKTSTSFSPAGNNDSETQKAPLELPPKEAKKEHDTSTH